MGLGGCGVGGVCDVLSCSASGLEIWLIFFINPKKTPKLHDYFACINVLEHRLK